MGKSGLISYFKGLAIIGVVIYHLGMAFIILPSVARSGLGLLGPTVHIFFFCSGFGLMCSQISKPLTYLGFLKKRFFKVYIPYILVILLVFCIPSLFPTSHNRILVLASHVFLFKMFVLSLLDTFGGQFWYVSTIFQFYFTFILLVKFLEMLGKKKFMVACCMVSFLWALCLCILGLNENRVLNNFFLQYLWEFAFGMIIAEEYKETGRLRFEATGYVKLFVVMIINLVVYIGLSLFDGFGKSFNDPFGVIFLGSLYTILYKLKILPKFIGFTSGISYEMYLLHILVFKIFFIALEGMLPQPVMVLLSMAGIYVLSYLYNRLCRLIFGRR